MPSACASSSTVPSVEPPSTTMCSCAGWLCDRTLASVASIVPAAFRQGVMTVMATCTPIP